MLGRNTASFHPAQNRRVMALDRAGNTRHTAAGRNDFAHVHGAKGGTFPHDLSSAAWGHPARELSHRRQTPGMEHSLANRLRTLRRQRNLTQIAVADAIGITRSHLSKIESGGDNPGRETLVALANFFEVSLDWLSNAPGDDRPARAVNDDEAILLFAYRQLPPAEAKAHLRLLLARIRGEQDS